MPQVLVVEDEAIAALALGQMLESLGCAVVGVAANGQDAIRIAMEAHPDVVLMDVRLKGEMSGIDSARAIHGRLQVPIIFTTAYSVEELRETCNIEHRFSFITKPIREADLAQAISAACGQACAAAHGAGTPPP
jgi:CheY-like chemotaxis protein